MDEPSPVVRSPQFLLSSKNGTKNIKGDLGKEIDAN